MYFALGVMVITTLVLVVVTGRNVRRFNEQWPPIDDEEFVRLCGPNTNRDLALRVRRIIADWSGVPYERIHPEQHFIRDFD